MHNVNNEHRDKVHPKERANILSRLFFFWQLPILFEGYRKQFTESDLHNPLKEHQSKLLGDKLEKVWLEEVHASGIDASLWKVLAKVFGLEFVLYGLCLIPVEVIFRMSEPFMTWKLVHYYTTEHDNASKNEVYIYASCMIVMLCLKFIGLQNFWFGMEHLGAKIRVACSALIYRKCLCLSEETLSELTAGQIINLVATDVTKFNNGFIRYVHYLWLVPILAAMIIYSLYSILGGTAIIGAAVLLAFIPAQIMLSKVISKCRLKMAGKTDQRIRLIHEIIQGIKVIKMMCWEEAFIKLTEDYREAEMQQLKSSLRPVAINTSAILSFSRTAIFLSILAYILSGHSLHAEYIYLLTAFYEIIKIIAGIFGPWALTFVGEIISSVKRIEAFLKSAENNCDKTNGVYDGITLTHVTSTQKILSDVSLRIKANQMTAIIGPVGSGKSTILKVILNEIPHLQGSVQIGATISYAAQEPWIFDGTVRENILFGELYHGAKYDEVIKVCALERDFALFPYGDSTLVGSRGTTLSGGQKSRINLARAVYKDTEFYLLDDPLSSVDAQVGEFIFSNCFQKLLKNKTIVLVTHQLQYLNKVDFIYAIEKGINVESGTFEDLKSSHYFKSIQMKKNVEQTEKENYRMEERKESNHTNEISEKTENVKTEVVSSQVYKNYLKASGGKIVVAALLAQMLAQFIASGNEYLLTVWSNFQQRNKNGDFFLYFYTGLAVTLIPVSLAATISVIKCCTNASKNLHQKLLYNVVHASINVFNNSTSGRILNRFSSDIGQIDRNLPINMVNIVLITSQFFAIVVLISIINYWILIPTVVIMTVFFYARKIYLATSRVLKRVEANSRSPVYSHLTTTIQGLATIRVLQAVEDQKRIFESHLDKHTAAYYMFLACDSAFGFWLDFSSYCYFVTLILSLVFSQSEIYGGNVGLALTSSILFVGMLQYGMKEYAELENQMVAVERILEYIDLDNERGDGANLTSKWPTNGQIDFSTVSLRYNPNVPSVLKQITFTINSNDKIGIVGRTGAGKSSLISVLFRLFDFEGDISIDGINTKTIPLHTLRSKISIIPQEPVLFSCSVRKNLDPYDEYQDSHLWNALEDVKIREMIASLPAGLSTKLTEGGQNLSVGERQLLCLARAIVKMNKIIILDEATANVDLETEDLIKNAISKKFKMCTVMTIAHRIHTVMDCDKVLVMGDGRVLEYDSPSKLLQDTKGAFYGLVHLKNNDDP
ncbi:probable multidrug resistance-associated protein lethal(2)03659 isoform X2 [Zophobas morio]|uniref:probable multidrug resistance-associated protein lethal(2)03659 isoform X2 n=1 Tax=Zophobas morio TaxID=2755281 RepID=UPI0030831D2D